jgi:hypothetical protein
MFVLVVQSLCNDRHGIKQAPLSVELDALMYAQIMTSMERAKICACAKPSVASESAPLLINSTPVKGGKS